MLSKTEIFKQKKAKIYSCGHQHSRYQKPYFVLMAAFQSSSKETDKDEKAVFKNILDTAKKTPTGRRTIKELAKLGCQFSLVKGVNAAGFYHPAKNRICFNPNAGYDDLSTIFIHEGRHAIQQHRMKIDMNEYQVADYVKYNRAIEADACAHEAAYINEIKDIHPKIYEENKNFPMAKAYSATFGETANKKEAMNSAFQAWYSHEYYRDFYDMHYKDCTSKLITYAIKENDATFFQKQLPAGTLENGCLFNGKPYIDSAFLNAPLPYSLAPEDKKYYNSLSEEYARSVPGVKKDTSVNGMYTRLFDGTIVGKPEEDKTVPAAVHKIVAEKSR